jgi:hypothetical protein
MPDSTEILARVVAQLRSVPELGHVHDRLRGVDPRSYQQLAKLFAHETDGVRGVAPAYLAPRDRPGDKVRTITVEYGFRFWLGLIYRDNWGDGRSSAEVYAEMYELAASALRSYRDLGFGVDVEHGGFQSRRDQGTARNERDGKIHIGSADLFVTVRNVIPICA